MNDLILYDMIEHGWKGKLSLVPFFSEETNFMIHVYLDRNGNNIAAKDVTVKVI